MYNRTYPALLARALKPVDTLRSSGIQSGMGPSSSNGLVSWSPGSWPATAPAEAGSQQLSKRPLPLLLVVRLALHGGVGVSRPVSTPLLPVPLAQSELTRERPGVTRSTTGWLALAAADLTDAAPTAPEAVALLSPLSFPAGAGRQRLAVAVPELSELVDVGETAASGDGAGDAVDCVELVGWLWSRLGATRAAELTPDAEADVALETGISAPAVPGDGDPIWLWTAI